MKYQNNNCSTEQFYTSNLSCSKNKNPFEIYLNTVDQSILPLYEQDYSYECEADLEYMKFMYPKTAKIILFYVEDECDKLEFDGSCMFDCFPDKIQLGKIVDRIYEKTRYLDTENTDVEKEDISASQVCSSPSGCCRGSRCYPDYNNGKPNWMRGLIEIILYNEMMDRRRRYRNRKRWF